MAILNDRQIKTAVLIMLVLTVLPAEAKPKQARKARWKVISEKNEIVFYKKINPDGTENLFISNQLLPEEVEKLVPSREFRAENKKLPPKNTDINLNEISKPASSSDSSDNYFPSYKAAVEETNADVAITPTGKDYHRFDCSYLKDENEHKNISVTQAKNLGYTPCARCKPPLY